MPEPTKRDMSHIRDLAYSTCRGGCSLVDVIAPEWGPIVAAYREEIEAPLRAEIERLEYLALKESDLRYKLAAQGHSAQIEIDRLLAELEQISKHDDWTADECRHRAREALAPPAPEETKHG